METRKTERSRHRPLRAAACTILMMGVILGLACIGAEPPMEPVNEAPSASPGGSPTPSTGPGSLAGPENAPVPFQGGERLLERTGGVEFTFRTDDTITLEIPFRNPFDATVAAQVTGVQLIDAPELGTLETVSLSPAEPTAFPPGVAGSIALVLRTPTPSALLERGVQAPIVPTEIPGRYVLAIGMHAVLRDADPPRESTWNWPVELTLTPATPPPAPALAPLGAPEAYRIEPDWRQCIALPVANTGNVPLEVTVEGATVTSGPDGGDGAGLQVVTVLRPAFDIPPGGGRFGYVVLDAHAAPPGEYGLQVTLSGRLPEDLPEPAEPLAWSWTVPVRVRGPAGQGLEVSEVFADDANLGYVIVEIRNPGEAVYDLSATVEAQMGELTLEPTVRGAFLPAGGEVLLLVRSARFLDADDAGAMGTLSVTANGRTIPVLIEIPMGLAPVVEVPVDSAPAGDQPSGAPARGDTLQDAAVAVGEYYRWQDRVRERRPTPSVAPDLPLNPQDPFEPDAMRHRHRRVEFGQLIPFYLDAGDVDGFRLDIPAAGTLHIHLQGAIGNRAEVCVLQEGTRESQDWHPLHDGAWQTPVTPGECRLALRLTAETPPGRGVLSLGWNAE